MAETDTEVLGAEGLHKLASEENKITSLVIGYNTCENMTWSWLVTHPMSLELETEEGRDTILEQIEDLQKDTAIIVTDLSSSRPMPIGCAEAGDLSSWGELAVSFGEI